jgi:collagenase-like PrtC family protease
MTKLVLEIPQQSILDALLPLLKHLNVRFTKIEPSAKPKVNLAEAIRVVRMGCDMSNFGDALQYQIEARHDRNLPFRD